MRVLTSEMESKLHKTGFTDLGLKLELDGLADPRLKAVIETAGPSCLLLHKDKWNSWWLTLLQQHPDLSILWLSSAPVAVPPQIPEELKDRLYGLKWGLPSLDKSEVWKSQQPWKRTAIEQFVKHAQLPTTMRPDWRLLEPPVTPECVIASYICALAGTVPDDTWAERFSQEVDYWRDRPDGREIPALDWSLHRKDVGQLRHFLQLAGAIGSGPSKR